jgi:hypothetical protein
VLGASAAASSAASAGPTGLHGFLLRADEPASVVFHRTPSFAWQPLPGATGYELQLSMSSTFRENAIFYDTSSTTTPVAAPSLVLPWITGSPHSLFARVRAILSSGETTPWSADLGFDVLPPPPPAPIASDAGLLRWTPSDGATGYQVWLVDVSKRENAQTNVLDERELYTFHRSAQWTGTIHWRVRAVRSTAAGGPANGLPVTTYGAWSPTYSSANPAVSTGPIALSHTISDVVSDGSDTSSAHRLMTGFTWSGDQTLSGASAELFRVYVFTDAQCLNRVFTSAVVGSPAYAPRPDGPLALPGDAAGVTAARSRYLADGVEPAGELLDGTPVTAQESAPPAAVPAGHPPVGAPVDLWDTDSWPKGGYYWTVVGVAATPSAASSALVYRDLELPQDVCEQQPQRRGRFGITSEPAPTAARQPVATGLSPQGRLLSAAAAGTFFGQPLVAWTPSLSADTYEVQWSARQYPFIARGSIATPSSATVLPLTAGTWYYRVRGFDSSLPAGAQALSWSDVETLVVAAPRFTIARDALARGAKKKLEVVGSSK